MLLDIRNVRLSIRRLFINPLRRHARCRLFTAGDPGGLAYMADNVLSGDLFRLKNMQIFFIGYRHWAIAGLSSSVA